MNCLRNALILALLIIFISGTVLFAGEKVLNNYEAGHGQHFYRDSKTVSSCGQRSFILYEDFLKEAFPPQGWTRYLLGDQSRQWSRNTSQYYSSPASAWHNWSPQESAADGWLISPQITLPQEAVLSFWQRGLFPSWYKHHGVYISNNSQFPLDGDFILLHEAGVPPENWTQVMVDLSDYAEQDVYLAFVYQGDDGATWYIDDIAVFFGELYAFSLTLHTPDSYVPVGESVVYHISLNNEGFNNDLYEMDILLPNGQWDYSLYSNDALTDPVTGPLEVQGFSFRDIYLKVTAPYDAETDEVQQAILQAVSINTGQAVQITIATTAIDHNYGVRDVYKFANSIAPVDWAPVYEWVDLELNGSHVIELEFTGDALNQWATVSPVPLSFNFPFYYEGDKAWYDSVHVGTAGFIQFGEPVWQDSPNYVNQPIPSPDMNSFIAYFWEILCGFDVFVANELLWSPRTLVYSGEDKFVVSFIDYLIFDDTQDLVNSIENDRFITAQIILYPDGGIKLQYKDIGQGIYTYGPFPSSPEQGTVGIANQDGSKGIQYRHNGTGGPLEDIIKGGLAISFYPLEAPSEKWLVNIATEPSFIAEQAGISGNGAYLEGDIVSVSVGTISQFEFVKWMSEDIEMDTPETMEQQFTMPGHNVLLTAKYEQIPVTAPWLETFEEDSNTLILWCQEFVEGQSVWEYEAGSSGGSITGAHEGLVNARFVKTAGTNFPITKLITPALDLSGLDWPNLRFFYGQEKFNDGQNELKVYYRTSAKGEWVEMAHYADNTPEWTESDVFMLPHNTYQVAFEGINNQGYANVLDNVEIYDGEYIPERYSAVFTVIDSDTELPVENAHIAVLVEYEGHTGPDGILIIENFFTDGQYSYLVISEGYMTYYGDFTIDGESIDILVSLEPLPPLYSLTMYVLDSSTELPVDEAYITIQSEGRGVWEGWTNAQGIFFLENEIPDGTYSYSVSASGYHSYFGDFIISGIDKFLIVGLDTAPAPDLYLMTFLVLDSDTEGPVKNASVHISASRCGMKPKWLEYTDEYGLAYFELYDGTYFYNIFAEGYESIEGQQFQNS